MSTPSTELRAAIIARLKADTGVRATALGSAPRIFNRAPPEGDPRSAFPYLVVREDLNAWDTDSDRGAVHDVEIFVLGEGEGDREGEAILFAVRKSLRDWSPAPFSTARLINIVFRTQGVRAEEGGRRYNGLQRWRAVTEEI